MGTSLLRHVLASGVVFVLLVSGVGPAESRGRTDESSVDQLLRLNVRPFAIGHRGYGENLGTDPSRPIENTVAAVRRAFSEGISVVEVDVQLTRDGQVAVFHDDFLDDLTCINQLTLAELQQREPQVPSLQAILDEMRQFNQSPGPLRGVAIVELKAAAPLCDPYDVDEKAIVSAVTTAIEEAGMTRQVMLTSFSPALLYLAARQSPEITRILSITGLQFLTAAEIEALLGLPVTPIDKNLNLGLPWAELGVFYRLPGYQSIAEVLSTAAVTAVRVVEADLFLLSAAGAPFVQVMHASGLKVLGFTANDATDWFFLQSLGLDGIYTNDIPFGIEHEAPIP